MRKGRELVALPLTHGVFHKIYDMGVAQNGKSRENG